MQYKFLMIQIKGVTNSHIGFMTQRLEPHGGHLVPSPVIVIPSHHIPWWVFWIDERGVPSLEFQPFLGFYWKREGFHKGPGMWWVLYGRHNESSLHHLKKTKTMCTKFWMLFLSSADFLSKFFQEYHQNVKIPSLAQVSNLRLLNTCGYFTHSKS